MITQTAPGEQLAGADWAALTAELDAAGCARTPRLLTPAQCRDLAGLYDEPERFRATIDMARHRFGDGRYRYFDHPLPETIAALRAVSGPHGFNLGMNLGTVAGAGIAAHLHQHVVPRWGGDTNFMPVIGRTRVLPQLVADARKLIADAWPSAG